MSAGCSWDSGLVQWQCCRRHTNPPIVRDCSYPPTACMTSIVVPIHVSYNQVSCHFYVLLSQTKLTISHAKNLVWLPRRLKRDKKKKERHLGMRWRDLCEKDSIINCLQTANLLKLIDYRLIVKITYVNQLHTANQCLTTNQLHSSSFLSVKVLDNIATDDHDLSQVLLCVLTFNLRSITFNT